MRVHAAAITRHELEWPTDRLPAIPSYELSGVVVEDSDGFSAGGDVFALTPLDRDGVAADYALVPMEVLAPQAGFAEPHPGGGVAHARPQRLAGADCPWPAAGR